MVDWEDPSIRERWTRYHLYLNSHCAQTCQIYYRTDELQRWRYSRATESDSHWGWKWTERREQYYNAIEDIKRSKRQERLMNALRARLKAARKSDGYHRCCWN